MGPLELAKFVKKLGIRQQAIATAQVYLRRFYLKVEIRRTNPILVMTTALYLACKMEECPQHIRVIVSEARNIWPGTLKQYQEVNMKTYASGRFHCVGYLKGWRM